MADPFSQQGIQDTISGPGRFVPTGFLPAPNHNYNPQLQQQQDFAARQSALDRQFQQTMAQQGYGFQGTQADLERAQKQALATQGYQFQGTQADLNRQQTQGLATQGYQFQGNQADLNRQFQAQQATQGYQFQGEQASAQRATELQQAQIAANASMFPAQQQQARFNQLFPMLQGSLNSLNSNQGATDTSGSPKINVGGVYTPQQTQQQVNAARATNDQATATQNRQTQSNLAGRGYGANSPLLQALNQQGWNQNLATNTANERTTRQNAAQQNAGHLLGSQQAREAQYASRQQEGIARRGQQVSQSNALLAAIAGLS